MNILRYLYVIVNQVFSIIVILFFTFPTLTASEISKKSDTLTFIHITDPHVCNLTGYHPFFIQKRLHFGNNIEPLSQFFKSVPRRQKADFVAITGDNIDYYEAEKATGGMLATQIEQYSGLLDICEVPVYLTLGNHDIASYYVNSNSTYTSNQFNAERSRATWIRNVSCFKDGTCYSRVINIDTTSFRLIFLDNSYYSTIEVSDSLLPFTIDQSQLLWLNAQLKASKTDVEIIFMHMPVPFRKSPENNILSDPFGIYSSKTAGFYNLLSVLENNSSTRLILAGHNHINNIYKYFFPNGKELTQVMTAGFGYDPNAWRTVKITGNSIIIYFPGSSKTEYIIPLQ